MSLSKELLAAEADRLVARAERELQRHRDLATQGEIALRAERELKRLNLYRAVLKSANSADALMPEYVFARGLVDEPADEIERLRRMAGSRDTCGRGAFAT
jgi:hypothetical protein